MLALYYQPPEWTVLPAYRPIVLSVVADPVNVVYCDIYINYRYYKTLSTSTREPGGLVGVPIIFLGIPITLQLGLFRFDISDAVKEFLTYQMPLIREVSVIEDNSYYGGPTGYCTVFCKFRGSANPDGVLIPDPADTLPVQGTADSGPIGGSGLQSNAFYVLNAAPDFTDFLDFEKLLNAYGKKHQVIPADTRVWTLLTQFKERVYKSDYNLWPILIGKYGFTGISSVRWCQVCLNVYMKNGANNWYNIYAQKQMVHDTMYYIPTGIANIVNHVGWLLNWDDVAFYEVFLWDVAKNKAVAKSPTYFLEDADITYRQFANSGFVKNYYPERKRIWFQNKWGVMQGVSFPLYSVELNVTSGGKQYLRYPATNDESRLAAGLLRRNVRADETVTVVGYFSEEEMAWLKELFVTTSAYEEWEGNYVSASGTVYQELPTTIQVKIEDSKYELKKIEDRYVYEVEVKYTKSMRKPVQRG